jgi:hypothetical protein
MTPVSNSFWPSSQGESKIEGRKSAMETGEMKRDRDFYTEFLNINSAFATTCWTNNPSFHRQQQTLTFNDYSPLQPSQICFMSPKFSQTKKIFDEYEEEIIREEHEKKHPKKDDDQNNLNKSLHSVKVSEVL